MVIYGIYGILYVCWSILTHQRQDSQYSADHNSDAFELILFKDAKSLSDRSYALNN